MHAEARKALEELQHRAINNLSGYVFLTKKGQPLDMAIDDIWGRRLLNERVSGTDLPISCGTHGRNGTGSG